MLELHITGPELDERRILTAGQPELVLGRDPQCGLRLPDPQRNVSRRHVAVWNLQDELHFRVLSSVNGVEGPAGTVPPGAVGVLLPEQGMSIAQYRLEVRRAASTEPDPWAVFDGDASGTVALGHAPTRARSAPDGVDGADDDPFGDWGFRSTFGPGAPGGGPVDARGLAVASDLAPFLRGLGLDPAAAGALTEGELQTAGEMVRAAMLSLFDLHRTARAAVAPGAVDDGTRMQAGGTNPLTASMPDEDKLRFLFGGRAAGAASTLRPERALRALLAEIQDDRRAVDKAVRATVEAVLLEFEPEALRNRLLGKGGKLFESARAWDAFARHWRAQSTDMPLWVQRHLDNYFTKTTAEAPGPETQGDPSARG